MIIGEMRSYEVSLWTLQDEFITVLKWSDVEQSGRVQEPKMELNVDGTQKFTFSIPMYLNKWIDGIDGHAERVENPLWYRENFSKSSAISTENMNTSSFNVINWNQLDKNVLIVSMRKIKVIFNKSDIIDDNVFEFVITKVTEEHKDEQLMCKVECEGLAFHELGKIGYKINLSQDNFELVYKEYNESTTIPKQWTKKDGTTCTEKPIQNVQYWCSECLIPKIPNSELEINPNQWYYDIQMNWTSSASGREQRANDRVYENSFTSAWSTNLTGTTLIPAKIEECREKARPISVENSNLYNITQTIAETFGIYCKYKYGYDENYHIISRTIIFFNNYLKEDNLISFSYPHSSKSISRELDGTELTTKLYIVPQEDDTILSGLLTIADSPANEMREDYILNFDYLYTIGAINKEQYDAVGPYKAEIYKSNQQLENYNLQLTAKQNQKIDLEAEIGILKKSIAPVQEQIDYASDLYNSIDISDGQADGKFTREGANHYTTYIRTDDSGKYINFSDKGIISEDVKVYKKYNTSDASFSNDDKLSLGSFIKDEHDGVTGVYITSSGLDERQTVYATYNYKPQLYYQKVIDEYTEKKKNIDLEITSKKALLSDCETAIETLNTNYEQALIKKEEIISKFNLLMGPALREGYWQPDEYKDYGESKEVTTNLYNVYQHNSDPNINADAEDGIIVGWDTKLFDNEDDIFYKEGINLTKQYYPCVDLTDYLSFVKSALEAGEKISFIFNNNYSKDLKAGEENKLQNISNFTVGGKAQYGFIKDENSIKPVLILTGAKSMSDDQIKFMLTTGTGKGNPRLCIFKTTVENNVTTINMTPSGGHAIPLNKIYWVRSKMNNNQNMHEINTANISIAYPRIKFSDLRLKPYNTTLIVRYKNHLLEKYEDYLFANRNTIRTIDENEYSYLEYFVTLKPEIILKYGFDSSNEVKANYVLSNAATSIYLDGKEVIEDSAFPRVSYNIEVNILKTNYSRILYQMLNQLVMINDTDLKFANVFGYISGMNLDLDQPQNDTIEVKNYTTKFDDLFNTIVAQTETMKRNENALAAAAIGGVALNDQAFETSLEANVSILQAYLDSHFDTSEVVRAKLAEIFEEAGKILSSANSSLNAIVNLSSDNALILSGFVSAIQRELTPKIYTGVNQPLNFKVGDVWNKTDRAGNVIGSYVATTSSQDSIGGFTRTYDGTLAAIHGASLNIDAATGTMELLAENKLDIKSGGNLYIAADDRVDIVGNREVNIGGTTINIAASSDSGTVGSVGGINIVATHYNNVTNAATNLDNTNTDTLSKVLIHPEKIELGSADILMRGANRIQMITSRSNLTNTSALSISPDNGVWIGSGAGVTLYSGNVNMTESNGIYSVSGGSGASVELLPTHLLMGVSSGSNGTAVEITEAQMVIASGTADRTSSITGLSTDLIGAKFTKDSIGFAVSNNNGINATLMNNQGITIGNSINVTNDTSTLRNGSGSYVRIAPTGIDIGSLANLYINTNNFKLQTDTYVLNNNGTIVGQTGLGTTIMAIGSNLQNIGSSTIYDAANNTFKNGNTALTGADVQLLLNNNGLYAKGTIYATQFIAQGNSQYFRANANQMGFYDSSNNDILTISSSAITAAKNLTISSGSLTLSSGQGNISLNGGNISLASSGGISLNGSGSISLSSGNISLTGGNISFTGSGGISLASGSLSLSSGNISLTGGNISLTGGKVSIGSGGKLEVNMTNFKIDSSGNVEMTGKITASTGRIGTWDIYSDRLQTFSSYLVRIGEMESYNGTDGYSGIWLGNPYADNSLVSMCIKHSNHEASITTNKLYYAEADGTDSNGLLKCTYTAINLATLIQIINAYENGNLSGGGNTGGNTGGGDDNTGGGNDDVDHTSWGLTSIQYQHGAVESYTSNNVPSGWSWHTVSSGQSKGLSWFGDSSSRAISAWIQISNNAYYCDYDGWCLFNVQDITIDSIHYNFDANGVASRRT